MSKKAICLEKLGNSSRGVVQTSQLLPSVDNLGDARAELQEKASEVDSDILVAVMGIKEELYFSDEVQKSEDFLPDTVNGVLETISEEPKLIGETKNRSFCITKSGRIVITLLTSLNSFHEDVEGHFSNILEQIMEPLTDPESQLYCVSWDEIESEVISLEDRLKSFKNRVSENSQRSIENIEAEFNGIMQNAKKNRKRLDMVRNIRNICGDFIEGLFTEVDRQSDMEMWLEGNFIGITFKDVVCEDLNGERPETFELGNVSIGFDIVQAYTESGDGSSACRLVSDKEGLIGYSGREAAHPHDLGGYPCLGTYQADFAEAIFKRDVSTFIALANEFVHSYNSNDHAGIEFIRRNEE